MPRHVTTRSGKVVDLDRLREARQDALEAKRRTRRANALDLSADGAFAALIARRADLKEIEQQEKTTKLNARRSTPKLSPNLATLRQRSAQPGA